MTDHEADPRAPSRAGQALIGLALGFAPLIVRLSSQGLRDVGLLVAGACVVGVIVVHDRLRAGMAIMIAMCGGGLFLRPSLALVAGAMVACGMLAVAAIGSNPEKPSRASQTIACAGLCAASIVLLMTPLAIAPAAIGALATALALFIERARPTALERPTSAAWSQVGHAGHACASTAEKARSLWHSISPSRQVAACSIVVGAVAVLLALRGQREVLIDDAAITFRYAARIGSGEGFTYNPGDRTNGASAPLYTLILAAGQALGRDLETVARSIGVVAYGATAGIVTVIVARSRGLVAGVAAGSTLLVSASFRTEALTGMESAFAAALGVLVILLVVEGKQSWAGFVLGMALVNKVDAAFLAVAVGTGWWLVHRRPPWRLAAVAALSAAPWFVFAQLYFASFLPFSATQKLRGEVANASTDHDPIWMVRRILSDRMGILLIACVLMGVLLAVRVVRTETKTTLAATASALWVLLHGSAFSLIDLGDPYPWYTTVLFPPLVVGGILALYIAADKVVLLVPPRWMTDVPLRSMTVAALLVLLTTVGVSLGPGFRDAARLIRFGHEVTDFERFEETRRQAGRYVGRNAQRGEVVQSCFGWIAFGALDNPIREECPLSTRIDPGHPTWYVAVDFVGGQRHSAPAGTELVRIFESPSGSSYVYRTRP